MGWGWGLELPIVHGVRLKRHPSVESLDPAAPQLPESPKAGVIWETQVLRTEPLIQEAQLSTGLPYLSYFRSDSP